MREHLGAGLWQWLACGRDGGAHGSGGCRKFQTERVVAVGALTDVTAD